MPKCATTSTSNFVEYYGYKTLHWIGAEIIKERVPSDQKKFYIDFAEQYDCISDEPYHMLYKDLDEKYSSSKFIFVNRDAGEHALSRLKFNKKNSLNKALNDWPYVDLKEEYFLEKTSDSDFFSLVNNYNYHKKMVLDYFQNKKNLLYLELNESDKESKICNFLNLSKSPSIKFPHLNSANRK